VADFSQELPETVAAVDLGSNSFHMLVARTDNGTPVVVDRLREMVQLASGMDRDGRLTDEARDRAIECLRRFGQRVRHMPEGAVRVVGTNTLRSARETEGFLVEAEHALGHSIETISGIEEARLIFLGVTQTQPDPESRRLVVDIGGGSTELIVGEGLQPTEMESLYMGSITISRAHMPDGVLSPENWKRAKTAALRELEPVRARFLRHDWQQAVGASGTVRAIDSLVRQYGWSKEGITLRSLKRLRATLLEAGHVDRLRLNGLNPKRRQFIAGGAVILTAVFESLGIDRMHCSDGALREGLLYDLIGRIREKDVRAKSVEALADRCHVDWNHAAHVECTALLLLAQVAEDWRLTSVLARQFLSWAAQLHEIGLDIAHDHYHRHGQYIVAHSDLHGFSRNEQHLLAMLVRAHRRKFAVSAIRSLPRAWSRPAERLAILLRLAVVLHRSRSPEPLPAAKLSVAKKSIDLRFPDGWLDEQPLTRAGLEAEASYLEAAGYRLRFA
jgi:exopolyphosphatase/guanosine-5'-triphosphate,3'-diphosphate pyrophosphatase